MKKLLRAPKKLGFSMYFYARKVVNNTCSHFLRMLLAGWIMGKPAAIIQRKEGVVGLAITFQDSFWFKDRIQRIHIKIHDHAAGCY